jgi:hypothetical protein
MNIDGILARLEGVRQTGPSQYVARCPAHRDRSPSLSVRDTGDGRTLIHCFAGCHVEAVVAAIGMRMSDLMPEKAITQTFLQRPKYSLKPAEALMLMGHEINVAVMLVDAMAANASKGEAPATYAVDRLALAAARLAKVRGLVEGMSR